MKKILNILMATAIVLGTLTACEDVPMPFNNPLDYQSENPDITIDPVGSGTQEDPYNVAAAIAYASELEVGAESDRDIYIKGLVVSIAENYTTQYGNARFYISDDGSSANQFLIYRALYLGNVKYTSGDILTEGDEVIICGRVTNYGGTLETQQNKAYLYSLNGKTGGTPSGSKGEAKGSGTQDDPFNSVAAAQEALKLASGAESTQDYYIKGKVVSIAENYTTQYGNARFYISDDGTTTDQFLIYRALYLGNAQYKSGDLLKEGDEVIVCGKLTNYNGTPETQQNKAYLYSLNGKTSSSGSTDTGSGTSDAKAVTIAEFNAAAESTTVWYQLTGTVKNLKDSDIYGNFDLEDSTGSVYVYGLLSTKGGEKKQFQTLVAEKGIKEGSKITIIGNRGSYNNKIEVVNAYFVSIDGDSGSGSGTGTGGNTGSGLSKSVDNDKYTVTLTNSGTTAGSNTVTIDLTTCGLSHQTENPSFTLNGVTFTFAAGEGSTTPKYWKTGNFDEFRMYAKNTLTIAPSSGTIHSVVLQCSDTYNGTKYTGNDTLYANMNGSSLFICNENSSASGGTQLRIKTITITYAQ